MVVYEHLNKLFVIFPLDPKFRLMRSQMPERTEGTKELLLYLSFPLQAGEIRGVGLHKECKMRKDASPARFEGQSGNSCTSWTGWSRP